MTHFDGVGMNSSNSSFFFPLLFFSIQDVRESVLTVQHAVAVLDSKYERHETRERALGEMVKKGLMTLQKNQKIFEPMKATFDRLDKRVSEIETMMLNVSLGIFPIFTNPLTFLNHAYSPTHRAKNNAWRSNQSSQHCSRRFSPASRVQHNRIHALATMGLMISTMKSWRRKLTIWFISLKD